VINELLPVFIGFGGIAIQFPLPEDVEVSVNTRRKYVELKLKKGKFERG